MTRETPYGSYTLLAGSRILIQIFRPCFKTLLFSVEARVMHFETGEAGEVDGLRIGLGLSSLSLFRLLSRSSITIQACDSTHEWRGGSLENNEAGLASYIRSGSNKKSHMITPSGIGLAGSTS